MLMELFEISLKASYITVKNRDKIPLIVWNSVEAKVSFAQPLWIKLGFDPSALDFLV